MTVEEAIEGLKGWLDAGKRIYEELLDDIKESERHVEMFRMAIDALEKYLDGFEK